MENQEKTFTQAELDSIVSDRVKREQTKHTAELENLNSKIAEYEKKLADYPNQLKELNDKLTAQTKAYEESQAKIGQYELQTVKLRVAHEQGIPYELAGRLNGSNEEEIRKDAETIKGFVGVKNIPLKAVEDTKLDNKVDAAFRSLANNIIEKR